MTPQQENLKNLVTSQLPKDNGDVIDEKKIDDLINQFTMLPILSGMSDDDKNIVRKAIHEEHSIRLNRGQAIVNRDHKKWFDQLKPSLELQYWKRFEQYLLRDKGFSRNVVRSMDVVTDDIVDLLGNPNNDSVAQRRGLIIGDVQSGKTANYSGVICKAVDAGYRVIILLTGTSNDLRRQTQIRLDEAFLGFDSSAIEKHRGMMCIGVGNYNSSIQPAVGTTVEHDFNKKISRNMVLPLPKNGNDKPILFVIKKNVSVLKSLYEWMVAYNKHGESKIDNSLLLIDDEADYASINTRTNDDPTATNKCIKDILNTFRFASYVGFTATPYANIFIDPESNEQMKNEDLFPADYIYALESPSNYIGARNIFGPNAEHDHGFMIRTIDDAEYYYPFGHKKDADFRKISPSLKEAINTYLVANVIRDLDGQVDSYRSMMVNVTRFVDTQNQLFEEIKKYIERIQTAIKIYSKLPVEDALDNQYIKDLYEAFELEFSDTDYRWNEIQASLESSIVTHPILTFVANQGNKDLDYSKYPNKIRLIVVGGLALSRGLTLEGLMVSYIYRRSLAYDTLMQMGRWFGYRDKYDKYCRIYMDNESVAWYTTISDATDELRNEIKRMRLRGAIPLEFGLKVREDPEVPLLVTARNKMKTASNRLIQSSLSSVMIETQSLYNDIEHNKNNYKQVETLLSEVDIKRHGNRQGCIGVSRDKIVKFLQSISVAEINNRFDAYNIADFIKKYKGKELDLWDIYIVGGEGKKRYKMGDVEIVSSIRSSNIVRDNKYIRPGNNRLGSPTDMSFGLNEEQLRASRYEQNGVKKRNTSAKDYLLPEVKDRHALLAIYFIEPKINDKEQDKLAIGDFPAIGFAIGIPSLSDTETKYIKYRVNKIYQAYEEDFGYDEEDDDYAEDME